MARSHETPVLLDISADWCAPCRVLAPLLHKLVAEYDGKFLLGIVDADENMKFAGRYKVCGSPKVIAYSRGVEIDRFHSAQTEGVFAPFHRCRDRTARRRDAAVNLRGTTLDGMDRRNNLLC